MNKVSSAYDLLLHTLAGAGIGGVANSIPGALSAYGRGEDADRGAATSASNGMYLGALAGLGLGGMSIAKKTLLDVAREVSDKIPSAEVMKEIMEAAADKIGDSVSGLGQNVISSIEDVKNSIPNLADKIDYDAAIRKTGLTPERVQNIMGSLQGAADYAKETALSARDTVKDVKDTFIGPVVY